MMTVEITCPVCRVQLPVPVLDQPVANDQGLTVQIDQSFAEEHIHMHENCTCEWVEQMTDDDKVYRVDLIHHDTCPVHGGEL